jgi:hypothetical protein
MRLRQVALVARDLAAARADIDAILAPGEPFADPGVGHFGLQNWVWPVGDTFLEVVSPVREGTTAGRLLEKRGGDGGYMAIFQVPDIAAARAQLAAAGVRTVWDIDRPDKDGKGGVAASHLHPKDVGGAIVSVDFMDPPARWDWGGPGWEARGRRDVVSGIVGCEVQADDPAAMCRRWGAALGLAPERAGAGWRLAMEGGEVRFVGVVDGRGEGLRAVDVAVRDVGEVRRRAAARGCVGDGGEVTIAGTGVRLVEA